MPSTARPPPARASSVRNCFARRAALARSGPRMTLVARRMRSVTAAAAARLARGSKFGYTMRSIVPRTEKPASSATRAKSMSCWPVVPGTAFGSPVPTFIALLSWTYSGSVADCQPTGVVAWANELLENARVGRLGLLDLEGAPRVLPVTFAVAEGRIWSAIDNKPKRSGEPARLRFLRRDPRAALTVDRYSDDWDELAWVQVL